MPKLKFDQPGEHFYQNGVDHCVLFVKNATGGGYAVGVPWNGITAINESPSGAEPNPFYADNIKYLNILSAEDYAASVEAYTYPEAFKACEGTSELATGLYATQQERVPFGLVYRTIVGNDESANVGYIYHIVYNCLAAPTEKDHSTLSDSPDINPFSWEISTTPETIDDIGDVSYKPTAHLELDDRKFTTEADKAKLQTVLDNFYGRDPNPSDTEDEGIEPNLLLPNDIVDILAAS